MLPRPAFEKTVFCVIAVLFLPAVFKTAEAQLKFKGYVENRLFITFLDNKFDPADFKDNTRWGDYNRGRVEMSAGVSENSYVNVTVDYFTYHGYLLQLLRQPGSGSDPVAASGEQKINIDRAYIRLYFSRADLTIGKQRVSWGQSLIWSPFDVFNRVNFLEPQEEKSGVNAFKITIPFGITGSLEGVFAPETVLDESRSGARLIWNKFGSEYTVTAIHNAVNTFNQNIYGASVKTNMILGLWLEGAYYDESPLQGALFQPKNYFRWAAGADYSLDMTGKKLFMIMEYTHDESGETENEKYDYLQAAALGRTLLARDYVYGSIQMTYNDYTSFSATILANINDGAVMFMPAVRHSLFPNTDLTVGTFLALADEGTEFNPNPAADPLNFIGNSIIYCWLKLYF